MRRVARDIGEYFGSWFREFRAWCLVLGIACERAQMSNAGLIRAEVHVFLAVGSPEFKFRV